MANAAAPKVNPILNEAAAEWSAAFAAACMEGRTDDALRLIEQGVVDPDDPEDHAMDNASFDAFCAANRVVIDALVAAGVANWDYGLSGACEGGHLELVALALKHGATYRAYGLDAAKRGGHQAITDLLEARRQF
jgi:hypothetical protein